MKINVYQDDSVFEILASEWNDLLTSASTNVIFLTWEWQATWWRHMSPGELLVVTFRDEKDRLQGIAPLFISQGGDGSRVLSIVGCEDVSDYLDLVALPDQEQAVCSELLAFLTSPECPAWDKVQFCNLPEHSTAYRILREEAQQKHYQVAQRVQAVCPIIDLPGDWEQYLARLDKKQRHEIRRKMRRAETEAATRWYVVNHEGQDLTASMNSFIELHRLSSPQKSIFMDSKMRAFFLEMAQAVARRGWLHLSFIEMNGQKSAGMLSFDYGNALQVYNSGYDPAQHAQLSPGIVLLSYCIRQAVEQGRGTFDFLRGEEEYKYRFGARPTQVYELTLTRNGAGR